MHALLVPNWDGRGMWIYWQPITMHFLLSTSWFSDRDCNHGYSIKLLGLCEQTWVCRHHWENNGNAKQWVIHSDRLCVWLAVFPPESHDKEAQQWLVVRTSVADMKAEAVGWTLDNPATVRGVLARYRANSEGVKERPRKRLHPPCVQWRHARRDASFMVLCYISINCKLPLVDIQGNINAGGILAMSPTFRLCHPSTTTCCITSHRHAR